MPRKRAKPSKLVSIRLNTKLLAKLEALAEEKDAYWQTLWQYMTHWMLSEVAAGRGPNLDRVPKPKRGRPKKPPARPKPPAPPPPPPMPVAPPPKPKKPPTAEEKRVDELFALAWGNKRKIPE